jgi:hypothetical protein
VRLKTITVALISWKRALPHYAHARRAAADYAEEMLTSHLAELERA